MYSVYCIFISVHTFHCSKNTTYFQPGKRFFSFFLSKYIFFFKTGIFLYKTPCLDNNNMTGELRLYIVVKNNTMFGAA